ncbi:MAG: M23 family metallopeptidase [Cyanobacteria bacterium SBLK]|nr:M23 family metallopeptidase [Cyanobacteria bacterium SBLK]
MEGISLDGLSEAIASIESRGSGGYMATGIYTCADGGRNCGRAIGKYQTMSYTPMMQNEVSQVSGGKAWLDKLNSGYRPTQAEIMRYYPPEAQERAFQSEVKNLIEQAKRQIDPRSGGNFTGDRLIERVTQKWFGGSGSKVDAGYSDAHGRLSLYGYGVQAREYYNARGGNPDCSAILPKESEGQPDTKGMGATGRLINPAPGYPITSGFGPRSRPCARCSKYHPAVDLGTPMNTPIKAADGGTVIGAEWWDGYGKTIVIDHGNGMKTRYSHLNAIEVRVGQQISQGQQIGLSGATGYGTGPHLDFGVYRYNGSDWRTPKGAAIDPQSLIRF